jgi:hypothetical protein
MPSLDAQALAKCLRREEQELPEYVFTIRSGERLHGAPRVASLDNDTAAIGYACELVQNLKKGSGYDDPNLLIRIKDEGRAVAFSIPFRAACA